MNAWLEELRTNRRLRAGLLLIGGLLWLWALTALVDMTDAADAEQAQLRREIETLRVAAKQAPWNGVRDDARQALGAYRSRTWREESDGRMQALMQDWLRERLAVLALQPTEITVTVLRPGTEAVDGRTSQATAWPSEMRVVRSRLVFDFQGQALHDFLALVGNSPNWLWVSRMVVHNTGRRNVELELEALFVQGPRGGA